MAENIFAKSPVELAQERAATRTRGIVGVVRPTSAPRAPAGPMDLDGLASQYQVPRNIIAAVTQAAGIEDAETAGQFAGAAARMIGGHLADGKDMEAAIKATFPKGVDTNALLDLADSLAAAPEPETKEGAAQEGGSTIGNMVRGAARLSLGIPPSGDLANRAYSAGLRGIGASVEGAGRGMEATADPSRGYELAAVPGKNGEAPQIEGRKTAYEPGPIAEGARAAGDVLRGAGDYFEAKISPEAQDALKGMTFKGDVFKPSTWEAPENPSLEGLAHLTVDVLGSMAPVVIASLLTRSPMAGAAAGGAQSAGFGAETARDYVDEAAKDIDESGVSRLERDSPYYRAQIAAGASPEDAVRLTSEAAQKAAAGWAAIPGAIGGAATGRILEKPLAILATRAAAMRIGGTAAASAVEEGTQEVFETAAARQGIEDATGTEQDLTADTLNDFVAGMIGGAPVGAAGGIRQDKNARRAGNLAGALDAAPPLPTDAYPTQDDANVQWVDDAGNPAEPPEPVAPRPPAPPPPGPISQAAAVAPDMPEAPAPLAANQPKGAKVRILIPGGKPIDATFQEETEAGMTFEADGAPFFIPREQIDAGEVAIDAVNPLADAQAAAVAEPTMPEVPEQSPFSEQVQFDVLTEVDHEIARATRAGGTGAAFSADVTGEKAREAMRAGARSAAAGATVPPSYGVPELDQAAMAGFEAAKNRLETRLSAPPTGRPGTVAPPEPVAPARPRKPTLQKRPFTNAIKSVVGGIDPDGLFADELRVADITPQTAPGLFRRGGAKSLDNLPASEWADFAHIVGEDGNGYLSEQGIIDAIVREAAGEPIQVGEQVELQAAADALAELDRLRELGLDVDGEGVETIPAAQAEQEGIVPAPSDFDDFTLGADRAAMVRRAIRDFEAETGLRLTPEERRKVYRQLYENGGSVDWALWRLLDEDSTDGQASATDQRDQDPGPPLLDGELPREGGRQGAQPVGGDLERSEGEPEGEGEGEAGSRNPVGARKPDTTAAVSPGEAPGTQDQWWRNLPRARHAAKQVGFAREDIGDDTWTDLPRLVATVNERLRVMGFDDLLAPEPDIAGPAQIEAPKTEQTPEGEQTLIPGVAPVTDKDRAEAQAKKPKRGGNAPADFGLFDTGARAQGDMFAAPAPAPAATQDAQTPKGFWTAAAEGTRRQMLSEIGEPGGLASSEWDALDGPVKNRVAKQFRKNTDAWQAYDAKEKRAAQERAERAAKAAEVRAQTAAPSKADVEAAATETDPAPTEAQKEAENYKTGKIQWNGLTLSIENAKGSTRSGTARDGTEWSVTMPAHYGRILGTKGADGDHVDFYMGDAPDADYVVIVNQVDPDTGKFDEHKVILGTMTRGAAMEIYRGGFSDGSANRRIGSFTVTTVDNFKGWLEVADENSGPTEPITMPYGKRVQKPKAQSAPPRQEPAGPRVVVNRVGRDGRTDAERGRPLAPTIENIRERAAVLKGFDEGYPPIIEGVSLKWDAKAGGFIFSRKHVDKVRAALGMGAAPAPQPAAETRPEPPASDTPQDTSWDAEEFTRELTTKAARTVYRGIEYRLVNDIGRGWRVIVTRQSPYSVDDLSAKTPGQKWTREEAIEAAQKRAFPEALQAPKAEPVGAETAWREDMTDPARRAAAKEAGYSDREADRLRRVLWHNLKPEEQRRLASAIQALRDQGFFAPEFDVDGRAEEAPASSAAPAAPRPAKSGILSSLSAEKQARAEELKAKLAAKVRNQTSSGLDPDYIILGGELVALYVEGGARKFGQMLRDFAESTGLTIRQAQEPMRAAYNHVRDNMDLAGDDVSGMDDAAAVMAEVRAALAEEDAAAAPNVDSPSTSPAQGDMLKSSTDKEPSDDSRDHAGDGRPGAEEGEATAEAGPAGGIRSEAGGGRGSGGRAAERPGKRFEPEADGSGNRDGERAGTSGQRPRARNHVIPAGGLELARGEKTRARESIAAIRALRELEASGVPATADQREALAKYGGAGTLAGALPRQDGSIKHPDLAAELDALLTDDEKATLSRTSQYAFYTAETVLRSMWRLAQQLGFKGGRVYEPGMGVGGFAGTVPDGLRAWTEYSGLELDHVTAAIAAKLYPAHKIRQGDFIKEKLPQGYYDMVIGNPPFAATRIEADKDYPQRFMLHDYFFAKSLDAVRPGGLLMFVTSAGTMNKLDSKARDYLADRADLVGAIRLPNTAFKENGTEVTTDIVVLRKRLDGEVEANPSWRQSEGVEMADKDGGTGVAPVNRYFISNPNMVLGEQGLFETLTGAPRLGVRPRPESDLEADLQHAVADGFPKGVMSEARATTDLDALDTDSAEKKTGSYYIKDGELFQFDGRTGHPVQARGKGVTGGKSKSEIAIIRQLIPLKDALRDVYAADVAGADAAQVRRQLNRAYDQFVQRNGPIGKQVRSFRRPSAIEMEGIRQQAREDARAAGEDFDLGTFDPDSLSETVVDPVTGDVTVKSASLREVAAARKAAMESPGYSEGDFDPDSVPDKVVVKRPNIDAFMDDPESYRLLAIEDYDDKTDTAAKTRVFTENVISRSVQPAINSAEDALLYLLAETGRVDLDRIAELAGSDLVTVRAELEGKVFKNPASGEFETRATYLSGNVRRKLEEAQDAALKNQEFAPNVAALESVQPQPVTAEEIRVPIGAHWFDAEVYSDFAKAIGMSLSADFNRALGVWTVRGGDTTSQAARNEWGTNDKPFADLMALLLNNKKIEVRRKDQDGKSFLDEEATQAAKDKAKEVQARFSEWIWEDEARTAALEDLYNKTFNAEVAPEYDGSYLTTPGINASWSWRPHQTAVISRILQAGSTYMAHTVGAGKTSAMIGAGMEARRLGLAKKPMYSVPNHMLAQFTTEFYQQYPLAKILVADEKRFHTSTRKQFIADAALGDWDAIIITHSAFGKIPPSEASVNRVVEGMLADIKSVLTDTPESGFGSGGAGEERAILGALGSMGSILGLNVKDLTEGQNSTRKKIEALIEAAEQRMSRQIDRRDQDQVFDFDELGVDMLFVDEAHLFRKLSFATTNGNIKGVDPNGSNASMDLFIKTRALDLVNPGRSLVLASGTPITNTMAELYSISRYLQPDALEERGIAAFDAWASTFGSVEAELEQLPDGGYKQISRFSKFVNTPELSLMVRQRMDIVTGADLEKYVTRPKLKNGKRTLVLVEPSAEVKEFQSQLAARMDAIAARRGPVKKGDDILLSVINDGRLSAIDTRLVGAENTGAGSKLEAMIQNIYRTWKQGANSPLHGVRPEGGYTKEPIEHGPTTQIVFSTLGVNPPQRNPSFSVHRFVRAELIRMGVPAADIVLAEDLKTHALKQRAFNDMNEGKKRILIGSKGLFTGVNAQRRLAAIHNLDPLWFPADDEQRNGRGLRQGNMNPEIEIFDYSTKGTYDATMWQMMARKAGFIEGFFRGDPDMREMEDLGEASQYQQATALSTRDPRVLELTELRQKRDELDRRRGGVDRQKRRLANEVRAKTMAADKMAEDLKLWSAAAAKVVDLKGDKFTATVGDQAITERKEFGQAIIDIAVSAEGDKKRVNRREIGEISGFKFVYSFEPSAVAHYVDVEPYQGQYIEAGFSFDPVGMARRVEGVAARIADIPYKLEAQILDARSDAEAAREQQGKIKEFAQLQELRLLEEQVRDLEATLESEAEANQRARTSDAELRAPDGWGEIEPDAPITEAQAAEIAEDAQAELAGSGLAGKVTAKVVRKIERASAGAAGVYRRGRGQIEVRPDAAAGPIPTLRHEIVHVLRDKAFWGRDYGLFTQAEWQGLVRDARRDKAALADLRKRYPDLDGAALNEEAVAEMYRRWRETDGVTGPFAKVRAFFEALANAFRGRGFQSAARTMQMIADGRIGGRGDPNPTGPGGGFEASPEARQTWKDQLRAFLGGTIQPSQTMSLGPIPEIISAFGGRGQKLVMPAGKLGKVIGKHKRLKPETITNLPSLIANPFMLISQRGKEGSGDMLLVTDHLTLDDEVVVVAIKRAGQDGAGNAASVVVTLYGKDRFEKMVLAAQERDQILYLRGERAGSGYKHTGANSLNAPLSGTLQHLRASSKIRTPRTVFKSGSPPDAEMRGMGDPFAARPVNARSVAEGAKQIVNNALTQAMAGKGGTNILALVPGRALLEELGANMPSIKTYLGLKEKMDTLRNKHHAQTDELAQKWRKIMSGDKDANARLMDLMHDSTIAGQDPSKPFMSLATPRDKDLVMKYGPRSKTGKDAADRIAKDDVRRKDYDELHGRFMKLPAEFRAMYGDVRDAYSALADDFEQAIEKNAEKAMSVAVRRAERAHKKRLEQIADDGLTGKAKAEAIAEADAELKTAKMRYQWAKGARIQSLRARFEDNRLSGPYFPLARFGNFFATVRDAEGKVVSFSRFEKASEQKAHAAEMEAEGYTVEIGAVDEVSARDMVDPGFVADIEGLLQEIDADEQIMDAVWQRWLQTLPDMSLRKSRIHRKGTPGYSGDAFRAFGYHMFHGAHQLARLTYSLDMAEALDVAKEEARSAPDPVRAGLIVKEVGKRHDYVMNPKGSAWSQALTSAAFVYYLGMTPAAAIVNLTQTTVVGIPILGAFHGKGGVAKASRELLRAAKDFAGSDKLHAENSKRLTKDERAAMKEAYERGTIDKSQSHDLAGVGETGVEYSATRTRVMGVISFMFHHTERANREITYLAAYRMARAKGLDHEAAITKAADLTWKTHFDYQNTSRPRLLQNDYLRVAFVFRNFQINMLWRLFRDTHQALVGADAATRTEARRQLVGITGQMLLNAGVKGVWGYSILMALAGMFFPGGSDDAEKEMEKALLALLPRDAVGMLLNGVPGHLLGIDLTSRIGMPDLWFRAPDRALEGEDEYNYWVQQLLGAVPGMAQRAWRGAQQVGEGNIYRGIETAAPKAIRDIMRSGRYIFEGAQTYNGDPIIDQFRAQEVIAQVIGFTPARLSERYDANTRLKNEEKRITSERSDLMKKAGKSALKGRGIPPSVIEDIQEFNAANPDYPITGKSLQQSIRSRAGASARNEFGVQLNPKLNRRLREDAAPLLYDR